MYIIILINIFVISIILSSFVNLKLSIALYIAYWILVPGLQINLGGASLSYNVVNIILLLVFLYNFHRKKHQKLNFTVVAPFLFLFFSLLFISLFSRDTPWAWQFDYWRGNIMQTCILSFIIWNLGISDPKSLRYIKWALIITIVISGVYGLYLTQLGGANPYTSLLANHFGTRDAASAYANFNDPRLDFSNAEKIQSTMVHPMTWALILCFTLVVTITLFYKSKTKLYWILIGLILFNVLISGVRTGIAAIALGAIYFLIRYRKFQLILGTIVLLFCTSLIVQSNSDLSNLFSSFVDVSGSKSDVSGSSISMRLTQLNGAIDEMKGNELVGKGYEWSSYYMTNYGDHPVLLDFESLVFVVLCNSGIFGAIIWSIFFILLFRLHRKLFTSRFDIYIMDSFVIVFLSYTIGTGDYGYLKFFSIFYAFLLAFLYIDQQSSANNLEPDAKNLV